MPLLEKLVRGRSCGASAAHRETIECGGKVVPAAGDWRVTVPVLTPGAGTWMTSARSFKALRELCALDADAPISGGTVTGLGPWLSVTWTVAPSPTRVSGAGFWPIAVPVGLLL